MTASALSSSVSDLLCEWCGGERAPTKKNACGAKCRAARWRWLHAVHSGTGQPPEPPPWPASPLHGRMGAEGSSNGPAVAVPKPGPRSGLNARSGTMLSFRKAVSAVREVLDGPEADAAERALTESLAPTQRRKVEKRRADAR